MLGRCHAHSWGQDKVLLLFLTALTCQASPSAAVLAGNEGVSKFQFLANLPAGRGGEGTSKDRLRHGYNQRDGTVVGTFSWDGEGFSSPHAPPQSCPGFCESESSALPARAKESSGVQGRKMTGSV